LKYMGSWSARFASKKGAEPTDEKGKREEKEVFAENENVGDSYSYWDRDKTFKPQKNSTRKTSKNASYSKSYNESNVRWR